MAEKTAWGAARSIAEAPDERPVRTPGQPRGGGKPEDHGWQRRCRVRVSHGSQGKRQLEQKTGASSAKAELRAGES